MSTPEDSLKWFWIRRGESFSRNARCFFNRNCRHKMLHLLQ